jgi:hypothetical protein
MAKRAAIAALIGATCLCWTAGASSDPDYDIVLAKGKASGSHARATAIVIRKRLRAHYKAVTVEVTSSPAGRVAAGWTMTCYLGTSFGRTSSDRIGRTPISIPVYPGRHLYLPTVAEQCSIVADAVIRGHGRVAVAVVAR